MEFPKYASRETSNPKTKPTCPNPNSSHEALEARAIGSGGFMTQMLVNYQDTLLGPS